MVASPPRVFISYSHDSTQHKDLVLRFAERLRKDGIDAQIDQYVKGRPPGGWPRWMLDKLDWAEFVLLICTETYYRHFRGHEELGTGKGVDWEGQLITLELYQAKSRTTKFVPVIFVSQNKEFIPEPLRDHPYRLDSEDSYQELYSFLTGQSGVPLPELGEVKTLPRTEVEPLTFGKRDEEAPLTGKGVFERFAAQNSSEMGGPPSPFAFAALSTLSGAGLSLKQKMELVDALLAVPAVQEPETRKNILKVMRRGMVNRIRRAPDDHTDVFNIVDTCLRHPGGMEELVKTVHDFDSGTHEGQLLNETLKRLIP
jgi:Effector-associated domain 2/SEFIR domain